MFRGGGCYFGPDITERILRKHDLELLVRSHECKYEGYEYMHGEKVWDKCLPMGYFTSLYIPVHALSVWLQRLITLEMNTPLNCITKQCSSLFEIV